MIKSSGLVAEHRGIDLYSGFLKLDCAIVDIQTFPRDIETYEERHSFEAAQ